MQKPRSKKTIPIILAIIALCIAGICIVVGVLFGGSILALLGLSKPVNPVPTPRPANPTPQVQAITPAPTRDWTVLVYSDADDTVLEQPQWFDVNEMELVGSTAQVNIVVQIDRHAAAFAGDGNWTDTRRFYVTQDNDLNAIHSPVVGSLGEADMGDPQTLVDFVTWGIENFPAQKYALVLSDHGGGWTGGWGDATSSNKFSIAEIADALDQIRQNTGLDKFELFGFDACLMGQIEVYGTFYPVANYMVASEEVIPSYGWAYTGWLTSLVQDPSMDGGTLGQAIVSTYVVTDTSLTDARATADEIAQEESTTTLSAVDSSRMPAVIDAMNQFINAVAAVNQGQVAEARTYSRGFNSVFGADSSPSFLDLENFAQVLSSGSGSPAVAAATNQLQTAISAAVIAEKHGTAMTGSSGISFYFPDSDIYSFTEVSGSFPTYGDSMSRFLEQSSWDEFLAFHYTGVAYVPAQGQAYVPPSASEVTGPGASELTISPLQISDTDISGDEVVTVSTTVTGNVAYIYTVLYFYNPDTDSYWIGDITYYLADATTQIGGVNYPNYGPSPVQVQYNWSPTLYTLNDGDNTAYALFEPSEYLSSDGKRVYLLYGQYTSAGSTTPVDAKLYFDSEGNYLYAYAFPDANNTGASTPVEITPQPGDTFTDYVQLIAFDENDEPYYDYTPSEDVWTWGDVPFSFVAAYPVDGEYAVGVIAYDFDNNFVESDEYINYTR